MNYEAVLPPTAGTTPAEVQTDLSATVQAYQAHVEACQYNQALDKIWRSLLDPANQYAERNEPWKLVKTDKDAAKGVLLALAEQLRRAAILLKPFLPRTAETIYRGFNFGQAWEKVRCDDVLRFPGQAQDLRVAAALEGGKVKPLFPRIA
jgi:methionyl-tRNA synthetase